MRNGKSRSKSPFQALSQRWAVLCCMLFASLVTSLFSLNAHAASAPMCDPTGASIEAPLPAPPSNDGEIKRCEVGRFVILAVPTPAKEQPEPLSVPQERLPGALLPTFSLSVSPVAHYRDGTRLQEPMELGGPRSDHRTRIERPPC
jgi:hypothetical protein